MNGIIEAADGRTVVRTSDLPDADRVECFAIMLWCPLCDWHDECRLAPPAKLYFPTYSSCGCRVECVITPGRAG